MKTNAKFWAGMAVFQILFGFLVFALTRDHYARQPETDSATLPPHPQLALDTSGQFPNIDVGMLDSLSTNPRSPEDPTEVARIADQHFANRRYAEAARYYEKLLEFDAGNADTLNNLGLTLHYSGRSDEALQRLEEGVAIDPGYQRIWLTLGYVNSQIGNPAEARAALEKAAEIEPGNRIGQSAREMLDALN